LDEDGVVVAETVGPIENLARRYPIAEIGPAVGYYSFRHGTAGVEEGYDDVLRGSGGDFWQAFWRQNLHRAQAGRDIRVTLDAGWQRAAEALLGEDRGAVVLLTLPDAAIRALASHPSYDPNELDEQFEELVADESAPLLNRATQGQYQPGLALQPFLIAAAVEREMIEMDENLTGVSNPVLVPAGQWRRCATPPPPRPTWAEVLRHACPAPMVTLAQSLTEAALADIFRGFGLTTPPEVPLNVAAPIADPVDDLKAAVIGQDSLTVTPLQLGLAWAALANEGHVPVPQLVVAVQGAQGQWHAPPEPTANAQTAVSAAAAAEVLAALPQENGTIREFATLSLAGPRGSMNGWYLGLAPASQPRYAVVVVVEDTDQLSDAPRVGRSLLDFVLAPAP
jgi:peptidoglycan glycosyltransferase